jgi:demethylmenaquinone methyltransferase/2-methoxy-6-polyprenyl-1,4-benzoquinol methylase
MTSDYGVYTPPSPYVIQSMFSSIASRYDLLNLLLSFGNDKKWRERAVRESVTETDRSILDVGTGSGKLLRAYLKKHKFQKAVGIDFCGSLLDMAKTELAGHSEASFRQEDILKMKIDEKFDIVSSSFVLRSIAGQLERFFSKVYSLLNPGGRFMILELTRPPNPFVRFFFIPYLKVYVPFMGSMVSGDKRAYRFLSQSIERFKSREEVGKLLKEAGFAYVKTILLSGGIGTIFIAERQ